MTLKAIGIGDGIVRENRRKAKALADRGVECSWHVTSATAECATCRKVTLCEGCGLSGANCETCHDTYNEDDGYEG